MGNLTAAGAAWVLSGGRLVDRCLYLALYDAGGDELSGAGYARQAVTWAITGTPTESNTVACMFTASGGDWDEATHWGLCGDLVAGEVYVRGAISATPFTLLDGTSVQFGVGAITLTAETS